MTDIHITLQWTEGEGEIYATLKGVFAKNERGYRRNAKNKRF